MRLRRDQSVQIDDLVSCSGGFGLREREPRLVTAADGVAGIVVPTPRQDSAAGQAVAARLELVTAILAVRVLWQTRTAEQTLSLLDPLWHWLQEHCRGLVQADGEGFYEGQRLILATG